jgi:hypothetical protein
MLIPNQIRMLKGLNTSIKQLQRQIGQIQKNMQKKKYKIDFDLFQF